MTTTTENLPAHLQAAVEAIHAELRVPEGHSATVTPTTAVLALHRAKLLAGDRDCSCNRSEDGERDVVHQRGDSAFCRDYFEPVVPEA